MRAHEDGVALIEVLIATFIIAIGMMGTIGLQLRSSRTAVDVEQRALALSGNQSIADFVTSSKIDPKYFIGNYDNLFCLSASAACTNEELEKTRQCKGAYSQLQELYCGTMSSFNMKLIDWQSNIQCIADPQCKASKPQMKIVTSWLTRGADRVSGNIVDRDVSELRFLP